MKAFLSQPILPSELRLVLAVAALAAVVVLEAAAALAAEDPVPDALPTLCSSGMNH